VIGEKKLEKLAAPDVWKDKDKKTKPESESSRKVGGNMLLEKKKFRYCQLA
jgi:hypothetical protein